MCRYWSRLRSYGRVDSAEEQVCFQSPFLVWRTPAHIRPHYCVFVFSLLPSEKTTIQYERCLFSKQSVLLPSISKVLQCRSYGTCGTQALGGACSPKAVRRQSVLDTIGRENSNTIYIIPEATYFNSHSHSRFSARRRRNTPHISPWPYISDSGVSTRLDSPFEVQVLALLRVYGQKR